MPDILIVEDEKHARDALGEVFEADHRVRLVGDVDAALQALEALPADLVLTDIVMPGDQDGLDLLAEVKRRWPQTPVVVMTAYGSVEKAVQAMQTGAHDFLEKPLDLGRLRAIVASALRANVERPHSESYRRDLEGTGVPPGFVGEAAAIQDVFRIVAKAAPTNATVLVLGESGTGKELVAEAIHRASARARGPFVKVNCAALPEGLLESELFGHVKGAFTGAVGDRAGRFESANEGTLFLDEVGEIPMHTQVKLLRVLQNREIERLGESTTRPVDVRLVAATNADLEERVRKGEFRDDFYFRLKVVTLRIPALRERRGDIPSLAEFFRETYAERHSRPVHTITPEAMALLRAHDWPGNVRELENVIEAAVVLSETGVIDEAALPVEIGGTQRDEDLADSEVIRIPVGTSLPDAERRVIIDTLERTDGNKTAAARILGIGLRTLYRKLESYKLDEDGTAEEPAEAD